MNKYIQIKEKFEENADEENAKAMSKYMRNKFEFYGIPSPRRKLIYKDILKQEKKTKQIDWDFLNKCYKDNHREFQYVVYDYLLIMKKFVEYEDIQKIRNFIMEKPWWDTIDFLCRVIGDVTLRDERAKDLMLEWSLDNNIWIKRTAIEHQLGLKNNTDIELLGQVIKNTLGSEEFFVNKAIGWALREYSKTNAKWVENFIKTNKHEMSSLSIKEGSKYI